MITSAAYLLALAHVRPSGGFDEDKMVWGLVIFMLYDATMVMLL